MITFNPATANTHLAFSNGNLTITGASGWSDQGARTTGTRSASGSFEIAISNIPARIYMGICNTTNNFAASNNIPGFNDANGIVAELYPFATGGDLYRNSSGNSANGSAGSYTAGDGWRFEWNDATDTVNLYRITAGVPTLNATANWAPDAFTYGFVMCRDDSACTANFSLF